VPIFQMNTIENGHCIAVVPLEIIETMKNRLSTGNQGGDESEFRKVLSGFDIMAGNPVLAIMRN